MPDCRPAHLASSPKGAKGDKLLLLFFFFPSLLLLFLRCDLVAPHTVSLSGGRRLAWPRPPSSPIERDARAAAKRRQTNVPSV